MTCLDTHIVGKPWGRVKLPPPFANPGGEPVGEIWFQPPDDLAALLVKYIFTSEKLSVQCHPSEAQAAAMGFGSIGKEECWYILDAAPGAEIAIGFLESIDADALRAAALDGTIEQRLAWHPVSAGDFFYVPAGTVHAIGAGIALIEIQQNSDVTFRLYDYGRPRPLHLDESLVVAVRDRYPAGNRKRAPVQGAATLVDGPHFRVDLIDGPPTASHFEDYALPSLILPLSGVVTMHDGDVVQPGQCARLERLADAGIGTDVRCLVARPIAKEGAHG